MGQNAKKIMKGGGAGPGKVAIQKTVNRGGKSFRQTFWVSPQEAMAMQRKAKKGAEAGPKKSKKGEKSKPTRSVEDQFDFTERAARVFDTQRWKTIEEKVTTPDKKGNTLPIPPPFEKHRQLAQAALRKHHKSLKQKITTLKALAPPGAKVGGRVKKADSALGKVQRKPKYGTADKLQDLTGTRVVAKTSQEVMDMVDELRKNYEVIEQDDYITPVGQQKFPNDGLRAKTNSVMEGGYRSFHMIAKAKDGSVFEVQIRTQNQHTWAEWAHDIYKPQDSDQEAFMKDQKHRDEIAEYGRAMSAYFESIDNPKAPKAEMPPCPTVIASSPFGCIS